VAAKLLRVAVIPLRVANYVIRPQRPSIDRCWPMGRERNVLETPKFVQRLSTPRIIMHQFQCQRSKVKVTRTTNAETGSASCFLNEKAYELQNCYADGACYQLPRPAIKAYEVGAGGVYRVCRTRRPHDLLKMINVRLSVCSVHL